MKGNVGVLRSRPQSWLPVSLWRTTLEPWCSNSPAETPDSVTPRWGVRGGMWLDTARGRSTRGRDTSWRTTTENTFPDQYKSLLGDILRSDSGGGDSLQAQKAEKELHVRVSSLRTELHRSVHRTDVLPCSLHFLCRRLTGSTSRGCSLTSS